MLIRHVLTDSASLTALTSYSGCEMFTAFSAASTYPVAPAISMCSTITAVQMYSAVPAAANGVLVAPVGHRLPNGASTGSPGNGSRYSNSDTLAIPNGVFAMPNDASIVRSNWRACSTHQTGCQTVPAVGVLPMHLAPTTSSPISKLQSMVCC